ncbi:MAG: hypothetical protein NBV57_00085 [Algoriphagus sp.]|jgi:hypothetical protein|nr:hypothetical protein [Algoriphagus sp.]
MNDAKKKILKEKIKGAIKISSQKLIEQKRAQGLKVVVSEGGKIREINP